MALVQEEVSLWAEDVAATGAVSQAASLLLAELSSVLDGVRQDETGAAVKALSSAKSVFVFGAGRSGLALRMVAMRLMHLGLAVHVVGETTAPAIEAGDLLIVASASGTTESIVRAATTARQAGARVMVVTAAPTSGLAASADVCVELRAASKNQFGERNSQQYAGSLFEQSVLLLFDAIFHALWQKSGISAELLMKRHANLE